MNEIGIYQPEQIVYNKVNDVIDVNLGLCGSLSDVTNVSWSDYKQILNI